jgi:glycosyltransferase involved in cell wall biosynthesis
MLTIAIPSYNCADTIKDAVNSALWQVGDNEVLVIDDCSTDETQSILKEYGSKIRFLKNKKNLGYSGNMNRLIKESKGEYIVFLCCDDMFKNEYVAKDIADIFKLCPKVSVVDRSYYQYMNRYKGAVVEVREKDVLVSCVNPSGIGIRKSKATKLSDKIYVEFPTMIKEMLKDSSYKRLPYDAVAVRVHKNNLATKKSYYKGSLLKNWYDLGNRSILWDFKSNYICIKNRAGLVALIKEIRMNVSLEPRILFSPFFWFFSIFSIVTPSRFLIELSDFYRHRISRLFCKIIHRTHGSVVLNLGCGKAQRLDSINSDVFLYDGIDMKVDLNKKFPFEDNSVDGIHASHVIEHLPSQEKFIKECYRVLKPGGFLRLNIPHSSCPICIGCMGHNRTYSYNTFEQYLSQPFYMFGKTLFKTTEKKLLWWYEAGDTNGGVPKIIGYLILFVNPIINSLARLSPEICENFWWSYVGGMKEVIWKGEKI